MPATRQSRTERQPIEHATPATVPALRGLVSRYQRLLEEERTRLAQELHDCLTQKLTVLSLELSLMEANTAAPGDPARWNEKIQELAQLVTDMIGWVRHIKSELRPRLLDEFGLVAAIEWETDAFRKRTGAKVRCKAYPDELALPAAVVTEMFRIFQEVLSNVEKHAHAQRVEIDIRQDRSGVVLRVSDDGRGIDQKQLHSSKSMGLFALRERTAALDGQLDIDSRPGHGTTVTIRVPIRAPVSPTAGAHSGSGV